MSNQPGIEEAAGASPGGSQAQALPVRRPRDAKDKYVFWETQPVPQFSGLEPAQAEDGPIDKPKTVADVRQEPYALPAPYQWCTCDFSQDSVVQEVFDLLSNNYVEDDDCMFRFAYPANFLRWALSPPGFTTDWLVGVRASTNSKLVGFISAIPVDMLVNGKEIKMVEINFLCVHKKLRSKRLAPVLIKEITRRVNLRNIWQAAFTAGAMLPRPIATCRYWHRSLSPKKLIDIGFSRLAPRMTMARTIKLYKLPDAPITPGIRPFEPRDGPQVMELLNSYLQRYRITQKFSLEDVLHWFTPRENVVDAYVVEDGSGKVTDFSSYYNLPSTVLGHPEHSELKAAYMFYTVPGATPLKQLMQDIMTLAHAKGYDVFNALDLLENQQFLKDLKFGIGDGELNYYLFNYRVARPLVPSEVGLILM